MIALILAALLLTFLACWLWYALEEPEAGLTPRRLWQVIHREKMDQHPVEQDYGLKSPDSVPAELRAFRARGFTRRNRWQRPERGRGYYSGMEQR